MNTNNKVAKFQKRRQVNIAVILFFIIAIYVIIRIVVFFTKDHLSIYEVQLGTTSDENKFTGLIIRDEEVIYTKNAGFINYYHRDGDRVAKNATIYSLDENQKDYDLINSEEDSIEITSAGIKELKKEILSFNKSFKDNDYEEVYDFKYNLDNTILNIVNDTKLNNLQTFMTNEGTSASININRSQTSGLITYSIDNLENLTPETVSTEHFNMDNYNKQQLRKIGLIESNSPVYKIVKDDKWSVILLLDENTYKKFTETESVQIKFVEDGLKVKVPISTYLKDSNYFARLDLDKYMSRYLKTRFIDIEIEVNSAEGLKIPNSSIVEKTFYKVPTEYFTIGGDSLSKGLIKEIINEKHELDVIFIPTEIYYSDEEYAYIDSMLFEPGDFIISDKSNNRYEISQVESLKGVYNVNKGYASFRRVEVLYENEEYSIIKKGTSFGLSVYDHIALEGDTAVNYAYIN